VAEVKTYIQVIVPLKLEWEPYYVLDAEESVKVGDFVAVPFAGRKYIGVVSACGVTLPVGMNPKIIREIYSVHSEIPPVVVRQLEFWRRVARYYMCSVGDVLKAACPASRGSYCAARKKKDVVAWKTGDDGILHSSVTPPCPALMPSLDVSGLAKRCEMVLNEGNALWLVPDSATLKLLETQLRPIFGPNLLCFSQETTPAKRYALELAMRCGANYLLLGTRAALFLPFSSLSLIVVQEEHSSSYKQSGISPRYNARDAAVMLAGVHGAEIVLQSPTPSLESIYNCLQKKYSCSEDLEPLAERLKNVEISVIDTLAEMRKNGMHGFVPKILLPGWQKEGPSGSCSSIAFVRLRKALFPKTEELEPQLVSIFGAECIFSDDPVLKPVPADTETVCVFGIDAMLTKNDFRADERTLQELYFAIEPCLGSLRRLVLLTRNPSHSIFKSMFDFETLLAERKVLSLPPFTRMVDIHLKGEDTAKLAQLRDFLAQYVPSVSSASYPFEDGWRVVLPKDKSLISRKQALVSEVLEAEKKFHCYGCVSFDVDP